MRRHAFLLLLASMAAPRVAQACSPPYCLPALVAPPSGTTLPANASALAIELRNFNGANVPMAELVDATGATVPTVLAVDGSFSGSSRSYLVLPSVPLTAGQSYSLRYTEPCPTGGAPPDGGVAATLPIVVAADAALPTSAGALSADGSRVETIDVATSSGSCTTKIEAATVRLAFTPDAALAPWLGVTRFRVIIDGKEWNEDWYGQYASSTADFGYRALLRVHARCALPDMSFDDDGLALGAHHAQLVAHLAGQPGDLPPIEADLTLTCSGATLAPQSGGCEMGTGATPLGAIVVVMLVVAVALVRARRG